MKLSLQTIAFSCLLIVGNTTTISNAQLPYDKTSFKKVDNLANKPPQKDPNLKIYSGPFKLNDIIGTAEYTYKDAPDGTRIFQGNFKFTTNPDQMEQVLKSWLKSWSESWSGWVSESELEVKRQEIEHLINSGISLTAEGHFDNDKQVGEWIWRGPWPINIKKFYPDQIIKFTFSEKGKLEGPAYFKGDGTDEYTFSIENDEPVGRFDFTTEAPNSTLKATWQNGHLVGDYLLIKKEDKCGDWQTGYRFGKITKGKFNNEGYPVGKWVREDFDGTISYAFYSDYGHLIEAYFIDDMTGDKIPAHFYIGPVYFNPAIYNARKSFIMRSTLRN